MNIPLAIAWIIVIIVLIVLVIISFRTISTTVDVSKGIYTLDLSKDPCYPNGTILDLPDNLPNQCCVNGEGVATSQRLYTLSNNQTMIVDIIPMYFVEACLGFCKNIDPSTGNCTDSITGINPYSTCINTLNPTTKVSVGSIMEQCPEPSLPVARLDNTPYYAVSAYTVNCANTTSC